MLSIFISCKNQTKIETNTVAESETQTENERDKSVNEMWKHFTKANPEYKNQEIPVSDFFHNNREDANRLAELTVNGKKKASSGLYSLYKQYNVDLPKVGTKKIITDFDGTAVAIIVTKSVDTIPFNQISQEYAELDMATNNEPLKKWKKAHWEFFENFMKERGEKPSENMLIVCERFETIWTKKHK